jgi:hypothetical protein
MMKNPVPVLLSLFAVLVSCSDRIQKPPSGIEHVIVIGVDGLSPDGIQKANTPVIDSMIANGSVKWNVRTVLGSSSSQNWASMTMGAGPEQHGIIDNDWEIDEHTLPPVVQEADGRFPSIFSVLRHHKPEAEIGVVYHWDGFGRLFQKEAVNYDKRFQTEDSTAADFIRYIKDKKPTLGFVHLDHVDHAGHHGGHGTEEYYKSVEKTDSLIGQILEGIDQAGIMENTLVILWSDHGGIGYGHGGATPEEAEIAGVFFGRGVRKGYQIQQQVYTYDLASSIAFALDVTPPYAWIGRPVKPVFDGFDEPENLWIGEKTASAPVIYPERKLYQQAGGLYVDQHATVRIASSQKDDVIRYTIDGSTPDHTSEVYKNPFVLDRSAVVKARSFDPEGSASLLSTAYFRLVKSGKGHGLTTSYYPGKDLNQVPVFSKLRKSQSWTSHEFNISRDQINTFPEKGNSSFALQYEGFIQIDKAGKYTFTTASDDGSKLYIGGKEIVDNDGNHGVKESTGSIELTAGKHPIRVDYYNNGGGFWLDVFYKGPDLTRQLIPADKLFVR